MKKIIILFMVFAVLIPEVSGQWQKMAGPNGGWIHCMAADGSNIFAGTGGGGIYLSRDSGRNWTLLNPGLTNMAIYSLVIMGENIFAATFEGVYKSSDYGKNWGRANNGLTNRVARSMVAKGNEIYVGTYEGVFKSANNGESWTAINTGLTSTNIWLVANCGERLFARTNSNGLFVSADNGESWSPANSGLEDYSVQSMCSLETQLFAGSHNGIFVSTDSGETWRASGLNNYSIFSLVAHNSTIYAGTKNNGVLKSSDNGVSWTAVNSGLTEKRVLSMLVSNSSVYAGTNGDGVFQFSDDANSWIPKNSGISELNIASIVADNTHIFVGTDVHGIFCSSDRGLTWRKVNKGLTYNVIQSLALSGENLIAGTTSVYVSSDHGENWTKTGLATYVYAFAICGSKIFAATGDGLYTSLDDGMSWESVNTGLLNPCFYSVVSSESTIFAGGCEDGASVISTDYGASWTQTKLMNYNVFVCALCDSSILVSVGGNRQFNSSDGGENWMEMNNASGLSAMVVHGKMLFGAMENGVHISTDRGKNWFPWNTNLSNIPISALYLNEFDIYAATRAMGLWKRPLSEATGIKEPEEWHDVYFYPNPVRNSITLRNISSSNNDIISIYSLQGQLIRRQKITDSKIDVSELAKGVYVMELQGSFHTQVLRIIKE